MRLSRHVGFFAFMYLIYIKTHVITLYPLHYQPLATINKHVCKPATSSSKYSFIYAFQAESEMMKNSFFNLFMAALPYLFNLAASNKAHCPLAPALYCFGASVTESGNNNYLPTMVKANYPPYGIDFVGGTPTGRFTNGKTIVDFLGKKQRTSTLTTTAICTPKQVTMYRK